MGTMWLVMGGRQRRDNLVDGPEKINQRNQRTLPIPIWKLKGFCPGSLVLQNGTDRSRPLP